MKCKKTIILLLVSIFLLISNINDLLAFPLRKANIGDLFTYNQFESKFSDFNNMIKEKKKKGIIVWRYNKSNSVKIFLEFNKLCLEKSILCFSVELDKVDESNILKLVKDKTNLILLQDKGDILSILGIFTLPLVIFLDEENKIINAFGYEGQFYDKISIYIDYITGKISKDEYENIQKKSEKVDTHRSVLPKLNFIIKLINSNKKEEAINSLKDIDIKSLKSREVLKLTEVNIKLEM